MNKQIAIKRLKLRKLSNTRDLGGLIAEGKTIKCGLLIRSGRLCKLPRSTRKKLDALNIKYVIDLRTEQEAKENPTVVLQGAKYVNLSLLDSATLGVSFEKDLKQSLRKNSDQILAQFGTPDEYMAKIYDSILFSKASQEQLKIAIKLIIGADGCVLWHCTSGKDRAGILAMLIETLLGVDEETVLMDYAATGAFQRRRNRLLSMLSIFMPLPRKTKKLLMGFLQTNPQHLQNVIDKVKAQYGSVIEYCKQELEISDEEILCMRSKYLA